MAYPLTLSQYELIREIGGSKYSTVHAARCVPNGKLVAIKAIDLDEYPHAINEIREQMSDWATISHVNMMNYYGSFIDNNKLYIVTELIDDGSLLDIIHFQYKKGIKDELLIASILSDVLTFLQYYHQRFRIHRCLETRNLLLSQNGLIKVGGFWNTRNLIQKGQMQKHRESRLKSSAYTAPELVAGNKYQQSVDIWSLGIIAIELATGKAPFSDLEPLLQAKAIIENSAPSLMPHTKQDSKKPNIKSQQQTFSPLFCDFVQKCLQKDPTQRLSASELLKHKFISQNRGSNYIYFNLTIHLPTLQDRLSMKRIRSLELIEPGVCSSTKNKINFDFCGYDKTDSSDKEWRQQSTPNLEISIPDVPEIIQNKMDSNNCQTIPPPLVKSKSLTIRKGRFLLTVPNH